MMVSHIVLRRREPDMPRPYRTPGGIVTTGFALVIAALAVVATFLVDSSPRRCGAWWSSRAFMVYFGALQPSPSGGELARRGVRGAGRSGDRTDDDALYRTRCAARPTAFDGLVDLLAKATPAAFRRRARRLRRGLRRRAGGRAVGAGRRPAEHLPDEEVVPYETDEVTRLIIDNHDRAAFAAVVAPHRRWLPRLAAGRGGRRRRRAATLARCAPGLTPEMVGGGQQDHAEPGPDRRRPRRPRGHRASAPPSACPAGWRPGCNPTTRPTTPAASPPRRSTDCCWAAATR